MRKNRLTINAAEAPAPSRSLMHYSFNVSASLVRNDTMEGRPYTVVPMVMIVEGVLNGSDGALYYPASELEKLPVTWNHKPVVVYHPKINGKGVSACDPVICTQCKIGIIMNTRFEENKLKAEAWIDNDRANKVDPRILEAVENNQTMELSTGLFIEVENTAGEFKGSKYDGIARNYHADHLAVLPDEIGACSIADGAGFIRNALGKKQNVSPEILERVSRKAMRLLENEMSFDEIRQKLHRALKEAYPDSKTSMYLWVVDVWPEEFVFENEAGILQRQEYKIEENKAVFIGTPETVTRETIYKKANGAIVGNALITNNETTMNKEKLIQTLIANHGFSAEDKTFLESKTEEQLQALITKNTHTPEKETIKEVEKTTVENKAEKPKAPVTVQDFISSAPLEIQEVLVNGMNVYVQEKNKVIANILANKRNTFSEASLKAKNLDELKSIEALAVNAQPESEMQINESFHYTLAGGAVPQIRGNSITVEPLQNISLFEAAK